MSTPAPRKPKKAPTKPAKPDNVRKPLNAAGWMDGTALPFWREQIEVFEQRWGRKLNPSLGFFAHDVVLAAIDPGFLLLAVKRLTDSPSKAAPAEHGITDKREMLGDMDAEGNDTRTISPKLAHGFAEALLREPDFVLAVMPAIRALWFKGNADACWQTPTRKDFARDLRAAGGASRRAIMLSVLDDHEPDDAAEDTIAAAKVVAPWLDFNRKDVENAKREHRKRKPLKLPAKRGAKRKE